MAFPGGLQLGGGVTADNAALYLGAGASHVIVTSWVFREGRLDRARLAELVRSQGTWRQEMKIAAPFVFPVQHLAHAGHRVLGRTACANKAWSCTVQSEGLR